jgi:glycosyltransferase involved in cell wall biosynthesis
MGNALPDVSLTLFFTRGVSLQAWNEIGMLEREVALYRRLESTLRRIRFVTYGDRRDRGYSDRLGGIRVDCNRWGMSPELYRRYLAQALPYAWRGPMVVKSNQVQGADIALAAARRRKKPFIARCGYLPSDNMERTYGADSVQVTAAQTMERQVFSGADRVVVTTAAIRERVINRYQVLPDRVRIIPNYVDTGLFRPDCSDIRRRRPLLYVGRLDEEKNPRMLLDALDGLNVEATIVGNGSQGEALRREAAERRLPVRFLGNVPNVELPRLLNGSSAFISPSLIEGHPKALLEAMACGVPVIGTNVSGTRELITDRITGLLCEPRPECLRAAIQEVLLDPKFATRMGMAARSYVAERFALDRIVEMELALLDEVAADFFMPRLVARQGASPSLVP